MSPAHPIPNTPVESAELWRRLCALDEEAHAMLCPGLNRLVERLAPSEGASAADAEVAAANLGHKLWAKETKVRSIPHNLRATLRIKLRHEIQQVLANRGREEGLPTDTGGGPEPPDEMEKKELRSALEDCIGRLNDRARAFFTARLDQVSVAEAAARARLDPQALSVAGFQAKDKLTRCLASKGWTLE